MERLKIHQIVTNKIHCILLLWMVCACREYAQEFDNTILFDQAQPLDDKNLRKIPSRFQGIYLDEYNNQLIINDQMISRKYFDSLAPLHVSSLDSLKDIEKHDAFLYDKISNTYYPYKIIQDSVYIVNIWVDTLYHLANDPIRLFKRQIILNKKVDDFWRVNIMELDHNTLYQKSFGSKALFKIIPKISNCQFILDSAQVDTLNMIVKPTPKQFKALLKLKDSIFIQTYKKFK